MSMSMNFLHDLNNEWCQMWCDGVKYNVRSGQIIIWRPFGQTFTISSPSPAWFMAGNVSPINVFLKSSQHLIALSFIMNNLQHLSCLVHGWLCVTNEIIC